MDKSKIADLVELQESRKSRIGMIYAALGAPMLGLAFGFAGAAGSKPPFNLAYPTGPLSFEMFEYMFGVLAIFIYALVVGTNAGVFGAFKRKISLYGVFVAMLGMTGDFLFFAAAAIVTAAIAGPLASLFGFWGAVITAVVYKEKILQRWTLFGVIFIALGLWIAYGGMHIAAPKGVSTPSVLIGALMGLVASICYGAENFAVSVGSDLMPEEVTLFWRAGWAVVGALIINFVLMPQFTSIASAMFASPMWWAYAAFTGGAWGIYMIVSLYVGISTAGAVSGGLLASTGFIWTVVLSMLVYGGHWSSSIVVGSLIMLGGMVVMLARPARLIKQLRS